MTVTPLAKSPIKNKIGKNIMNKILTIFSKEKNCFFVNSIESIGEVWLSSAERYLHYP